MADKNNKSIDKDKSINNLLKFIDNGMEELYRDTYFSTNQSQKELETIGNTVDNTIDDILNRKSDKINTSNISRLIQKTINSNNSNTDSFNQRDFDDIFGNTANMSQITTLHRENTYIKEYNQQIDTICKYFPKLDETVEVKIDNILSADHFTKDFLTINTNGVDMSARMENLNKVKKLRENYNIDNRIEDWLRSIIKYGEKFVSIVPYDRALTRLMNARNNGHLNESTTIYESSVQFKEKENISELFKDGIKVNLYKNGIIESIVSDYKKATDVLLNESTSLTEEFLAEAADDKISGKVKKIINTREVNKGVECDFQIPTNDGLTVKGNNKEKKININGAIISELEPEKVRPIWIGDTCVGYYYIDVILHDISVSQIQSKFSMFNTIANKGYTTDNGEETQFLNNLSKQISDYIDTNFINSNIDLKNEIYLILKNTVDYGNSIKSINVTFIPPEDMHHLYFQLDPKTHRGISELDKSMIPATIYIGLYLSNVIGIMTRGQDKRVYYVKQNVETNTAKTMLNVINQIKKNNFNFRTMNTIHNVLDIVGKYNDFIIPMSKGGDSPIQFDIMPGQQITISDDLYNLFEEQALQPTGVTKELLDARNSLDYAIQATMSNSKFLKKMLKKQSIYTPMINDIITKVYLYEYKESVSLNITLPAPQILNLNNVNQMINANNEYINTIIETDLVNETDAVKTAFKAKMTRYNLSSHIPYDIVDKLIAESKVEASTSNREE